MKIETIENEKKWSNWPVPCLVADVNSSTIILVTVVKEYDPNRYDGVVIKSYGSWKVGDPVLDMHPSEGWIPYNGKVILSND